MIDHLGLPVTDFDRSLAFYTAALAPLGFTLIRQYPGIAGFGANGKPDLWIGVGTVSGGIHVALKATGRDAVRAFYDAAMAAGGRDNGAPGIRAIYHADYYGAFVLDPDGHNVEAVCHKAYLD